MKKKIITGCIAAFVGIVAIITFTLEANAVYFCTQGNKGLCTMAPENPAFKCSISPFSTRDCDGKYDKPLDFVDAGRL